MGHPPKIDCQIIYEAWDKLENPSIAAMATQFGYAFNTMSAIIRSRYGKPLKHLSNPAPPKIPLKQIDIIDNILWEELMSTCQHACHTTEYPPYQHLDKCPLGLQKALECRKIWDTYIPERITPTTIVPLRQEIKKFIKSNWEVKDYG